MPTPTPFRVDYRCRATTRRQASLRCRCLICRTYWENFSVILILILTKNTYIFATNQRTQNKSKTFFFSSIVQIYYHFSQLLSEKERIKKKKINDFKILFVLTYETWESRPNSWHNYNRHYYTIKILIFCIAFCVFVVLTNLYYILIL